MKNLNLDNILFYSLLLVFGITYLIFFPQGWLISDEYSYVNQAIAIAGGDTMLTYTDIVSKDLVPYSFTRYSLGNAFWISIWIKILGLKWIYIGSLVAIVAGTIFLFDAIQKEKFSSLAMVLVFLYPSLAFFGRSSMSAVPSFLISCIFIWILMVRKESPSKWLLLCALASFSFWFRETNIILLGGVCLVHFVQDKRWFGYYVVGTVAGFIPRLISSYLYYDDPFYYVLAESFSLANIINNISIYAILILIAMPLGAVFIGSYRGKYTLPILISSFTFLALYLCYSFNASIYSGFSKGVILMGRFLIPLLPFFVFIVAWFFRKHKISTTIKYLFTTLSLLVMVGMQFKTNQESQLHKSVSKQVYQRYHDSFVFYDLSRKTNVIRYLNPMHGEFEGQSDIENLSNDNYVNMVFDLKIDVHIIQTINTANQLKSEKTRSIQSIIEKINRKYLITNIEEIKIKPNLSLQVLKLELSNG